MSKLNDVFFTAVLNDVITREQKLAVISNKLTEFFRYMEANPFEGHHHLTKCKFHSLDGIMCDPDYTVLEIYAGPGDGHGDKNDTQLEVVLASSGKVKLSFAGIEYASGEVYEFDSDAYNPAETVAKILTTIQDADAEEFGPHISATLQKIWAEDMGRFPHQGPGQPTSTP